MRMMPSSEIKTRLRRVLTLAGYGNESRSEGNAIRDERLIKECCNRVKHLAGAVAECGVYRGEGAKVICEACPDRTVHLFDTFSGFPEESVSPIDTHQANGFGDTSINRVEQLLHGCKNKIIHVGHFSQSLQTVQDALVFVHIDCDLYLSTVEALAWSWGSLVPGGLVLCDDYGYPSCKGAKQAIDEFVCEYSPTVEKCGARRILVK